ncbi:MAG: hypothetical protein B6D45_11805 [Ignavibacteriales bacterium UTCHB3]|nr:MAG: hypothetical protein B6D45_11805 [Ignavibacteriales bacterium UTCHB3]
MSGGSTSAGSTSAGSTSGGSISGGSISAVSTSAGEVSNINILFSVAGGLILGFSKTFWFQSTSVEVYSLHLALISAALYTLIRAYVGVRAKKDSLASQLVEGGSSDFSGGNRINSGLFNVNSPIAGWLLFAFVLALAFSNHLTTILIIPATALLFFLRFGFKREGWITLVKMLALFFPVLILIYLYLPIRAEMKPLLNWGNPTDLEHFMRHFLGKQYQVWLFSSSQAAAKNFGNFFKGLPGEFYLSLIPVLLGVFYLWVRSGRLLVFALLLIFGTVLYSINYDIVDLDSYFLLAYFGLALLAVFGLQFIYEKGRNFAGTAVAFAALVLVQVGALYAETNQSNNLIFEQYTKEILDKSPKHSIILSYQWDFWLSASYYFQFVEGQRKDVVVVDKELLRRSWYYGQLETCYPSFLSSFRREAEIFKKEVVPFEREIPYDGMVIDRAYRNVISAILLNNLKDKPVFIGPELVDKELANREIELPDSLQLVPYMFMYRLSDSKDYIPAPDPDFHFETGGVRNIYTDQLQNIVGTMLLKRVRYELAFNKHDRAKVYLDKIKQDFPETVVPPEILEKVK